MASSATHRIHGAQGGAGDAREIQLPEAFNPAPPSSFPRFWSTRPELSSVDYWEGFQSAVEAAADGEDRVGGSVADFQAGDRGQLTAMAGSSSSRLYSPILSPNSELNESNVSSRWDVI